VEDYSLKISGATFNAVANEDVSEDDNAASIAVIPNPVKSYSAVASLNLIKEGNVSLMITDLSGRVLVTQQVSNAAKGKNSVALSLSKLNNGVFMLVAQQNGVVVARSQLVVNR
jgi:hypothetical protein